jgi:hypothetical protein
MKKLQKLPEGLSRIQVPAAVARKIEARLDAVGQAQTALAIAQQDLRTACEVALMYEGATAADLRIAGVETGPDVYAIVVRKAPKAEKEPAPSVGAEAASSSQPAEGEPTEGTG